MTKGAAYYKSKQMKDLYLKKNFKMKKEKLKLKIKKVLWITKEIFTFSFSIFIF